MTEEIWKTIPFAPNYAVSNWGQVKRATGGAGVRAGRILRPGLHRGYPHVSIYFDGKMVTQDVHVLVAICFLGDRPSPLHEVAHCDGDRSNCRASNLRWATHQENMADKVKHNTSPIGEKNPRALITEQDVRFIREHPKSYGSRLALARQFNVSTRVIDKIRSGETWKCVT